MYPIFCLLHNITNITIINLIIFTAKFVVSRCTYCKLGFFCSVNHFSEGGVNANHIVTCSLSSTENSPRLLKNRKGNHNGEWIFCQRRQAEVALLLQVTRIRKIRKICKANLTRRLLPETGQSQSNKS